MHGLEVHPELSAADMATIVRQSIVVKDESAGEFAGIETIDEALALRLAGSLAQPT